MSHIFPIQSISSCEPTFVYQYLPPNALTYEEHTRLDTLIRPGYPVILPMGNKATHQFYLNIYTLIKQFQLILPSNIQIEEVSLIGSGMIQVLTDAYRKGKKKLKDLDLSIRISKPDNPYLVKNLFLLALSEEAGFSSFQYGFFKDLCVKQNLILISIPTVTRGSEAFHIDFSIVWEPETSCIGSANCFKGNLTYLFGIKNDLPACCYKETADGYNFERSIQLFNENFFEITPELAAKIYNGLRGYVSLITKNSAPLSFNIEPILIQKWKKEDPNKFWADLPKYIDSHWGNDPFSIAAFSINLRRIFEENGVEAATLDAFCLKLLGLEGASMQCLKALLYWTYRDRQYSNRTLVRLPQEQLMIMNPPTKESIVVLTSPDNEQILGLKVDHKLILEGLIELKYKATLEERVKLCRHLRNWGAIEQLGGVPDPAPLEYIEFLLREPISQGNLAKILNFIENCLSNNDFSSITKVWEIGSKNGYLSNENVAEIAKRRSSMRLATVIKNKQLVLELLKPSIGHLKEVVNANILPPHVFWQAARRLEMENITYQFELAKLVLMQEIPSLETYFISILESKADFTSTQLQEISQSFPNQCRPLALNRLISQDLLSYLAWNDLTTAPCHLFWQQLKEMLRSNPEETINCLRKKENQLVGWSFTDFFLLVLLLLESDQEELSMGLLEKKIKHIDDLKAVLTLLGTASTGVYNTENISLFMIQKFEKLSTDKDVLQLLITLCLPKIRFPNRKFIAARCLEKIFLKIDAPLPTIISNVLQIERSIPDPNDVFKQLRSAKPEMFVKVCKELSLIRCTQSHFMELLQLFAEKTRSFTPEQGTFCYFILSYQFLLSLPGFNKKEVMIQKFHHFSIDFYRRMEEHSSLKISGEDFYQYLDFCKARNFPIPITYPPAKKTEPELSIVLRSIMILHSTVLLNGPSPRFRQELFDYINQIDCYKVFDVHFLRIISNQLPGLGIDPAEIVKKLHAKIVAKSGAC